MTKTESIIVKNECGEKVLKNPLNFTDKELKIISKAVNLTSSEETSE